MELQQQDDHFTLVLNKGDNRFNPTFVHQFNEHLDTVEKAPTCKALLIVGHDRFFSNGLDLDWMSHHKDEYPALLDTIWRLLARILVFPLPTVAVINGHAFGAGLFLALACDWRVMRGDRGFLCAPEVDMGLPLLKFKFIARAKLNPQALRTIILTSKKWNAPDALSHGLIDAIVDKGEMLTVAKEIVASAMGKLAHNYSVVKKELYGEFYDGLTSTAKL